MPMVRGYGLNLTAKVDKEQRKNAAKGRRLPGLGGIFLVGLLFIGL